ncbi:fibronectin-binding protein A N-terminus-domain-containing protein [Microdochium bolleyi]|uniref:Ribosome quality control complex subunit 2 n=1 Tax=Microdochium bolleyi TaxID=196109 RepID=A0A136J9Y7_9PEZI|nr:fibronectin-binding protein A N-terminus-domain-containing protein [Microdochium bolleyi]
MKQRFSSLDVKVIAHELSESLTSLRVSNIYDLSSKILLFKFAKPEDKKQMLIDSGFRCHLTGFTRTTSAFPSPFVQKLRKVLKTRRVSAVSQIGTDRIIEFQFSDGQYRLYLEFFASGNIILTDRDLKILTLLRNVPEGEGQEPQRAGLNYSLENRQNYGGVPDLTKERVRNALQSAVDRSKAANAAGKKIKRKPGDELRKGLATTILELPPILVDHAMRVTGFDSTIPPASVLEDDGVLDKLLTALQEARKIVDQVTSSATCKGYILAKKDPKAEGTTEQEDGAENQKKPTGLLYDDFHPFLPRQFEDDPAYTVLPFENFNKLVDEFFSSIEGQKLESRLTEREAAAKRKLEAARADQNKRIEGLAQTQTLNHRKAEAIEANVERVQEAMDAVNGLIEQGMDWHTIGKLVDRERRKGNPVAAIINLPLKLEENTITLVLGEAEEDEDEDASETDSEDSDAESTSSGPSTSAARSNGKDQRLLVDINLAISPWSNAREYYDEKKSAAAKQEKTTKQSEIALKGAEQKIAAELRKSLKQEKPVLQPIRREHWFEKFDWFISSDGYLVLAGGDAQQDEILYRRYLKKGDVYLHADLNGASSVIIKNNPSTPDAPIPPSTLSQAGTMAVCTSSAWDSKAGMSAYWVNADQVSKSAPTGEYLPPGNFMIRGKKNFLPAAQLVLGFGLMFKITEESKAKHVKHRLYDLPEGMAPLISDEVQEAGETEAGSQEAPDQLSDDEDAETNEQQRNPLQRGDNADYEETDEQDAELAEDAARLDVADDKARTPEPTESLAHSQPEAAEDAEHDKDEVDQEDTLDEVENDATSTVADSEIATPSNGSGKATPRMNQGPKKPQPPKRGQRGKAKKIAAKYKDQDDEDRAVIESLIGSAAGKEKKDAEAQARAEKEAQQAAALERRKKMLARQQRETAEYEAIRAQMLEDGFDALDESEVANLSLVDALVGFPLASDEIIAAIPVCGPYAALGKLKYKVKLQPGPQKKGKAVKEIVEFWRGASTKKGVVDENSQDKEKMWPREVELIKGLRHEEMINVVPVGKVMISGQMQESDEQPNPNVANLDLEIAVQSCTKTMMAFPWFYNSIPMVALSGSRMTTRRACIGLDFGTSAFNT